MDSRILHFSHMNTQTNGAYPDRAAISAGAATFVFTTSHCKFCCDYIGYTDDAIAFMVIIVGTLRLSMNILCYCLPCCVSSGFLTSLLGLLDSGSVIPLCVLFLFGLILQQLNNSNFLAAIFML